MILSKKSARIAGVWYLLLAIFTAFGWYCVRSVYVPGDATLTVSNILKSERIYRIGLVSSLIGETCFLFLANALYKLFKVVDENLTNLLIIFIVACVPVTFLNVLIQLAPALFSNKAEYLSAFGSSQLHTLAMIFMDMSVYGTYISGIFFGLWLLPFGWLIIKSGSGFISKAPGILLIAGCFCYLLNSFTAFLFPSYEEIISKGILVIATPAEISGILWLFLIRVRERNLTSIETNG